MYINNLNVIGNVFDKIKNNPDNIVCIYKNKNEKGFFLSVYMTDGNVVKLTEEHNPWTFPLEPICDLASGLGKVWCKNFVAFWDNQACANAKYVQSFSIEIIQDIKKLQLILNLKNGETLKLYKNNKRKITKDVNKANVSLEEKQIKLRQEMFGINNDLSM